jgi:hypothetical protein
MDFTMWVNASLLRMILLALAVWGVAFVGFGMFLFAKGCALKLFGLWLFAVACLVLDIYQAGR